MPRRAGGGGGRRGGVGAGVGEGGGGALAACEAGGAVSAGVVIRDGSKETFALGESATEGERREEVRDDDAEDEKKTSRGEESGQW